MHMLSKCLLTAGISTVALLAAAPSFAAPTQSWYGGASGDLTWMGDSDTGGGGNVDLGYRFNNWRVEGEVGYHDASGRDGDHYWSYMGNAYYDFNNMLTMSSMGWNMSPYIGAGIGDASFSGDDEFAYQGMAGLTFASASTPHTTYNLGYKYFGTDDRNPDASNIELGLNYYF